MSIAALLDLIDEPNRSHCKKLLEEERQRFEASPGSSCNHQAWKGGYLDHIVETMTIAQRLYQPMADIHQLPFSLSDAVLVMFLHDLEKPWKYVDGMEFGSKVDRCTFRIGKAWEAGIVLTSEHVNALAYVEGEGDDYSSSRRVMGPLAAFCHMCDVASARIWHDYPQGR